MHKDRRVIAVARVLIRAGYTKSIDKALQLAEPIVLTVLHPELRWDLDDDQFTAEHHDIIWKEERNLHP